MLNAKEIGERIALHRKALNLTQTMLADKLPVSSKAISKWESGKGIPNVEILPELTAVLNITIDFLLLGEISTFTNTNMDFLKMPDDLLTPQLKQILQLQWLESYAEDNHIDFGDLLDYINNKSKPKTLEDCYNEIINLKTISCNCLQKILKVGFAKAAGIKEELEQIHYKESKNKEKIIEILKKHI